MDNDLERKIEEINIKLRLGKLDSLFLFLILERHARKPIVTAPIRFSAVCVTFLTILMPSSFGLLGGYFPDFSRILFVLSVMSQTTGMTLALIGEKIGVF